jgi:ribonuclease P protein component
MLPRQHRLTKNKDFENVARNGRGVFGKGLGIKWLKNNLLVSRFGIVVSLKVSKKAVIRNKIKRRLRAIVWQEIKKIKSGYDIIILTKPEIKEEDYWQIKNKLEILLEKSLLIYP